MPILRVSGGALVAVALLLQLQGCWEVTAFSGEEDERLIGWKGETFNAERRKSRRHEEDSSSGEAKLPEGAPFQWIETISWEPRAFIYHGFLSDEECEHLKTLARGRLERSMVVGEGAEAIDEIRTSFSASINHGETTTVHAIEERIARWTHLPANYGEPIEVLRYQNGQKYDAHWDWFEKEDMGKVGNRMATVLMYLSDVEDNAGGETALPLATPLDEQLQAIDGYSECASKMGLSVRPRKGDVLLFWDMNLDGKTVDRHALHASCPTFKGEKWTATKWIHSTPY